MAILTLEDLEIAMEKSVVEYTDLYNGVKNNQLASPTFDCNSLQDNIKLKTNLPF